METFSTDTLPSLDKLSGLRGSNSVDSFFASQLHLALAPHNHSWVDIDESPLIALCSDVDCHHNDLTCNHPADSGACRLLLTGPTAVYRSPSSSSKHPFPSSEEFVSAHFTRLSGFLDSPVVMVREEPACQRLLTPPTWPYSTLGLPDLDRDDGSENGDDEHLTSPSELSSQSADTDLSLSPISPTWDTQSPPDHVSSLALISDSPPHIHSSWLPFSDQKYFPTDTAFDSVDANSRFVSHHERSSLLGIDHPQTWFPQLGSLWSPRPCDIEHIQDQHTNPFILSSLIDYDEAPAPCSPLLSQLSLPEIDESPCIIPSSPFPRSSLLPLEDEDFQMGDWPRDSSSPSPSQPLLALPGAVTDDDLLPTAFAAAPPLPSIAPSLIGEPLLLIDDPQDVPPVRSPSPNDLKLLSELPPEGSQLFDMRKRYMAAEKSLQDMADPVMRTEVKKKRKRDLERSKEIIALLCLKFPGKVVKCRKEKNVESGVILTDSERVRCDSIDDQQQQQQGRSDHTGSIAQLVAQMVFRRSETSRPLGKRKVTTRDYIRSPLSVVAGNTEV